MKRPNRRCAIASLISLVVLNIAVVLATVETARADAWFPTSDMSVARYEHTATLLSDGRVLVAGGGRNGGIQQISEIYDPATGDWGWIREMTTPRYKHTATLLPDGRVLVTGGYDPKNAPFGKASAEVYNSATNGWAATADMSAGRYYHTATLLLN